MPSVYASGNNGVVHHYGCVYSAVDSHIGFVQRFVYFGLPKFFASLGDFGVGLGRTAVFVRGDNRNVGGSLCIGEDCRLVRGETEPVYRFGRNDFDSGSFHGGTQVITNPTNDFVSGHVIKITSVRFVLCRNRKKRNTCLDHVAGIIGQEFSPFFGIIEVESEFVAAFAVGADLFLPRPYGRPWGSPNGHAFFDGILGNFELPLVRIA